MRLPHLTAITQKNLPILHASHRPKKAIPEPPIMAYRRPKNLRDLLVSAELKSPDRYQTQGSSLCGHPRCLTCQHIRTEDTFTSTTSGRSFHVQATATCKTRNVISRSNDSLFLKHLVMKGERLESHVQLHESVCFEI